MARQHTNPTGGPSRDNAFDPDLSAAEFETEFWGRVLDRQPFYEDVLRRQAEALARAGRYSELVRLDQRLVQIRPRDAVVHYNLACTLSRLGLSREALMALRQAIRLGYGDFGHLETDPDLDPLRDLPEFQRILKNRRLRR